MSDFLKGTKIGIIATLVIVLLTTGFYFAIPWLEKKSVEGKVRQMNHYDEIVNKGCEK